jgi:hypothetical protein
VTVPAVAPHAPTDETSNACAKNETKFRRGTCVMAPDPTRDRRKNTTRTDPKKKRDLALRHVAIRA